jgi:prepilin-type N-terminal cleavage/methylation domain-containing protein
MVKENRQKGFTVIELMIAIALFGIVMPSIITAILSLNAINDRAGDLLYANTIAEGKIESLRSAGYNSLTLGTTDFSSELPPTLDNPRSASYTISSFENDVTSGVKEIDITISYSSYGKAITQNYKSLISELGIAQ